MNHLRNTGILRAAAETQILECPGMGTCAIQLSGTFVGTLVFEVSITKDTWTSLNVTPPNSTTAVTGATAVGLWFGAVGGMHAVRVRCSAFTSGAINVDLQAILAGGAGASGAGGGGGGGDASAANQLLQIADEDAIAAVLGTTTDVTVQGNNTGTIDARLRGLSVVQNDVWDSVNHRWKVDGSGVTQPVSAASLPLPSGASTSAKQDTGNTSLTSIDGKITAVNTGAVVISAALPAGANAIGKLAANSGVTIGAVEIAAAQTLATVTTVGAVTAITNALPAGAALIGKVGIDQTTPGTTNRVVAAGASATNVAVADGLLNQGAQGVSSENTAVTTGRMVQLVADLVGKLIVMPYANPENLVSGATAAMTGTTSTSLIAAPAAGLRNYITQITVSNSHATQGTDVIIQDGSGGTTLYTIPAAAVYGGAVVPFPAPLRQPTTATAIFCANVTTGASTKVSASGYKGA